MWKHHKNLRIFCGAFYFYKRLILIFVKNLKEGKDIMFLKKFKGEAYFWGIILILSLSLIVKL